MGIVVVLMALDGAPAAAVQDAAARAPVGEFRPPTPAERFRQDPVRNNLVHPEGYRPGAPNTFGRVDRRDGGATALVLVAGLGFDGRVFDPLLDSLRDDYTVYVVTLAGYGGSSAPPMPPEGTSYGERSWLAGAQAALGSLIDDEGLDRPLLGALYTDAANPVAHFARENPERVGGVLLVSAAARFPIPAAGPPRAERLDAFADQWFRTVTEIMWPSGMFTPDYYASSPEVAERAWWQVLEPSLPTAIRYLVESWADDLVPVVTDLAVPMIVLSPDFGFLPDQQESVRTRFHAGWEAAIEAGAELDHRIVPGGRFLTWEDAPDAIPAALRELSEARLQGG